MVRQWVMVLGDTVFGAFVYPEVFYRKVDKLLVLFGDEDVFISGLFEIGFKSLRFERF